MEPSAPRLVAIHQSFLQPLLIVGAERELLLATALGATALIFSLGNVILACCGAALWLLALPLLQLLAKNDPQMSRCYLRHVRYATYFPRLAHFSAMTKLPGNWSK